MKNKNTLQISKIPNYIIRDILIAPVVQKPYVRPEMYNLKPFYDEIKKFKLYSILTRKQKKIALSKVPIYKKLHK